MPYTIDDAVTHLKSNANNTTTGNCAKYVRKAILAGGVTVQPTQFARNFGPNLIYSGFTEYDDEPPGGYQKGDVVVIQAIGTHFAGHMQMFDGTRWISDFKQNHFLPGQSWAGAEFKVYRR